MTAEPIDHSARRQRQAEPLERRTFARVRRGSRPAGGEAITRLSRKEGALLKFALRQYRFGTKKAGQRWGAIGTIPAGAADMFNILVDMMVKRGKVEPSAAWLAKQCRVPISIIHRWKSQLKSHGFLDWRRRYIETGREGTRGPQVEQTTNAYMLRLPAKALDLVKAIRKKIGMPEDPRTVTEAELDIMRPDARRREDARAAKRRAEMDHLRSVANRYAGPAEAETGEVSGILNVDPLSGVNPDPDLRN